MGLLLKDVLKTLCGVNQWCYAVFWKIGCQNSKLLIWEECYYEPKLRLQTGNTLEVLVNRMMMNNQVHLIGQGIVGRAVFTGNHEWILAENYVADAYPPEVSGEIRDQLSGGMQTIAVIPTPHGVVQLGSSLTIMENMGFVNNAKSLILQLGCVPRALLSDNLFAFSTLNLDNTLPRSRGFLCEPTTMSNVTPSFQGQPKNGAFKAQVMPSNPNKQPSSCNYSLFSNQSVTGQPCDSNSILTLLEQQVLSDTEPHNPGLFASSHGGSLASGSELVNGVGNQIQATSVQCSLLHPNKSLQANQPSLQLAGFHQKNSVLSSVTGTLTGVSHPTENGTIATIGEADDYLFQGLNMLSSQKDEHKLLDENFSGSFNYRPKHDDLYDALGVGFKKKLFDNKLDSLFVYGPRENSPGDIDTSTFSFVQETSSDLFSASQGISDSSFFTSMDSDQLLDAVVSRANSAAKQSSDDNVSCKTTLTKIGGSSAQTGSPSYGLVDVSDHVQKGTPNCFEKSGIKTCSSLTSISGSQLSSWVSNNMKRDSSVSTAYSKKNDQTSKPSRKRLKPGENPRPRPKDRQMIQDRVKELREIVPNGAKCSIDALLERTIKHMLFLQSVTKHADKLKQTGESKIIGKEGGLFLKDNFEGGATWAFEVGSQFMVCPIIVEDLNSPRQMLIEMLCEERGLFLEIADLIRGLGLTILKGVMEARNGKIWARFAVEANRDVTRMEVFMSFVHLLEQTAKGPTSSENNMMVRHSFSQPTSMISATGSLQ